MEERSRFLQIMLQSSFCLFISGLKFVAIFITIKFKFKFKNLLNLRIYRCRSLVLWSSTGRSRVEISYNSVKYVRKNMIDFLGCIICSFPLLTYFLHTWLLPVELRKINYRHLPNLKLNRFLNLNLNFNSRCHKFESWTECTETGLWHNL